MKSMKTIIIISIFFFVLSVSLFAQAGSTGMADPYSTSMAKTYTISSRGIYSLGINPANLALSDAGHLEFSLPPNVNFRMSTSFVSINDYNYFFGGVDDGTGQKVARFLNDSDKDRFRELFKDGGSMIADFSMIDFGFTYKPSDKFGAIGFSVNDVFSAKFNLPAGIIDIALAGNPIGSEYNFDDFRLQSWYIRTYNLTYARNITELLPKVFKSLSVGVSYKIVNGYAYAGLDRNTIKLTTNADRTITETTDISIRSSVSPSFGVKYDFDSTDVSSSMSAFPQTAGSGSAIDIGFSAILNDRWSFGLAITDLGSITWKEKTANYTSKSTFTITDVSDSTQRNALSDSIKVKGKYTGSFTTDMPTAIRIGAAYVVIPEVFRLAADLNIGLNDSPQNEKKARFSIGGEWNPKSWMPYWRGGFSFGGYDSFSWAVGFGFNWGHAEFNAAVPDFQYIFTPKDAKRLSFSFGWRWKFD